MPIDMQLWESMVIDEICSVADEEQQKQSWFGNGPYIDSPGEQFCAFFDNASVPEFLACSDNGLSAEQTLELTLLNGMMRYMSDITPDFVNPADLIDDPRWQATRRQAKITFEALTEKS